MNTRWEKEEQKETRVNLIDELSKDGIKGLSISQNLKRQLASQYFKVVFSIAVILPTLLFCLFVAWKINKVIDNGIQFCTKQVCNNIYFK